MPQNISGSSELELLFQTLTAGIAHIKLLKGNVAIIAHDVGADGTDPKKMLGLQSGILLCRLPVIAISIVKANCLFFVFFGGAFPQFAAAGTGEGKTKPAFVRAFQQTVHDQQIQNNAPLSASQ